MTSDSHPHGPAPLLQTVIVGDDGGEGGRAALALARALADSPAGAGLVLAGVYRYGDTPSRAGLAAYAEALRTETETRLARTRDEAAATSARLAAVPAGSPARGLQWLAEREGADLIVVGSSHRGAAGRTFLGDVGRSLLHGAPCPVAVAPRRDETRPVKVIGVAYDGGPEAEAALRFAAALARRHDARLRVVSVVESNLLPSVAGFAFDVRELFDELRGDAQASLDRAVAPLGVPVEARAVVGSLKGELDRLADGVDVLVCGSRGWGAVRRVVLGSTADHLIHHAPCPVLVVPRPAGAEEAASASGGAERVGAAAPSADGSAAAA